MSGAEADGERPGDAPAGQPLYQLSLPVLWAQRLRLQAERLRQRLADEPAFAELSRIAPNPHPHDFEAAKEFAELVGDQVVDEKRQRLELLVTALAPSTGSGDRPDDERLELLIDPATVLDWMRSIGDLRLALAFELGLRSEEDVAELDAMSFGNDPERDQTRSDYYCFSLLQESLVETLDSIPPATAP